MLLCAKIRAQEDLCVFLKKIHKEQAIKFNIDKTKLTS